MHNIYTYIIYIVTVLFPFTISAASPDNVRWHNQATDTTAITKLLIKATDLCAENPNQLVEFIGREFIGAPYKGATLEEHPKCSP